MILILDVFFKPKAVKNLPCLDRVWEKSQNKKKNDNIENNCTNTSANPATNWVSALKPSQQHLSKLLRLIELYIQAAQRNSRSRAILIPRKSARITVKVTFSVVRHPFPTDLFAAKSE